MKKQFLMAVTSYIQSKNNVSKPFKLIKHQTACAMMQRNNKTK